MLEGLFDKEKSDKNIDLLYCFSYLSAPTKMLTEMVADQVAPLYWVPNKDAIVNRFSLIYNTIDLLYLFQRNVHHVTCNLVWSILNIIVEVCL